MSEINTLIAIEEVRKELREASNRGAQLTEMREIHGRLMSLYAALNVNNVLDVMDQVDIRKVA
jgi:plasmid rolling circle replication initiator protein Rep